MDDGPDGTAGAPNGGSGASAGSSSGGFGGSGASSGSSAVEECAGEGMQLDPVFVGERTRTGGTCADGDHPDASVRMLLGSVDDPERGLDQPVAVFAEAFSGAPFYCNLVDVAECEVRIDCSPEDHPDGDLAHSLSLSIGETTAHGTLTVQDQVAGCEADSMFVSTSSSTTQAADTQASALVPPGER